VGIDITSTKKSLPVGHSQHAADCASIVPTSFKTLARMVKSTSRITYNTVS
jgi:hypothetical protein